MLVFWKLGLFERKIFYSGSRNKNKRQRMKCAGNQNPVITSLTFVFPKALFFSFFFFLIHLKKDTGEIQYAT